MKAKLVLLLAIPAMAFLLPEKKKIKIFIAGDSTASIKEIKAFPENGWGMPFVYFWDSTVTVVNKAKNGRSTSSCFAADRQWQFPLVVYPDFPFSGAGCHSHALCLSDDPHDCFLLLEGQ